MIHNMEWYRVFYFTAKAGSLSKAAEELFITQPAVTHSIKQLESKLGGQLFIRTSKGVNLTAEGEVLFKYIEQAYHFISNGERKIAEMHQLVDGEIKIGAGDTLCRHYLLPHLQSYHEAYPSIKIQVTNRTTAETVTLLKEGKIDLGIINLPLAQPDNKINVQESIPITDCFVAGVKHKYLSETPISLEALLQQPIILLEKGSSIRTFIDTFAESQSLTIKPEIELGSIDLLVDFARSGFGIACVIKDFVSHELAEGSLYEIQLKNPVPPRKVGIVTLKGTPLSVAAKHILDMMMQQRSPS
ncbi:LysR family transcriptional regulator [Paenibacillus radicis (ex Xue et al. 2023)]|uniref:LysR family transcriptional regulator n=1 Tax=Paenibacillus radicis (ex Xue et al. 2023) TaxID=2972489 RepID=A0ABT1YBQ6_9BACL|nr:LysR family transcriptional regulator [Paenibacillus radicis (ex Xue et al. 2023)]MCR8629819.1 LysR family transcriptional regulator [Paenibacillus radicis (ex Xue et al. 2023)]